jgi:hypothetical protein
MDVTLTTGERIARLRTRAGRGLAYWRGSLVVFILGAAAALGVAAALEPVYRAECTVLAKARVRTDDRDDGSSSERSVRRNARLKDMLTTRGRLESAVRRFGLYPDTVSRKSMTDAAEEMKPHVGFRALEGGLYVISFDGHPADAVRGVTAYLADSLIDDYAAADLDDRRREEAFVADEERAAREALETATRDLSVFVSAHPEFAKPDHLADTSSEEVAALLRERARLEGMARRAPGARATDGHVAAAGAADEQMAQAQAQVDAAAKRVAETQADLASKPDLTEDHPDMRAARMAADAAARFLHEAHEAKLALVASARGAAPPELVERLRQIDAQIAARRSPKARDGVVELEDEWQRLLRASGEARSRHDDLAARAQRASLALSAARMQVTEPMAVVEPPVLPTHPVRGGRTQIAVAGLTMALLLAVGYASLRLAADDRLLDAEDVEALRLLPVLCVVPRIAPSPHGEKEPGHATV